jgi:cell division protein FtsZ
MKGAKGVLINITGGFDMTLYEVDAAANEIRAEVDPNANIILGSTFDERMDGRMRVSIVATGIDDEQIVQQQTIVQPAQKATQRFAGAPLRPPAGQLGGQAGVQAGVQPSGQSLGQLPGQFTPQPQAAAAAVMPAGDELRPSFARTEEDLRREAVKDGQKDRSGFSLFGWMRGGEDEARREDGARADGGEGGEDDIEIPAFLRRQMNPR